ncbi:hypothetical protein A2477_01250 [Candidatus Falkowbacteria bacterium RIFOXYC2_FULL_47_12]|uniref:Glycosyl transferase family 1 domain-containing protein n=2 Tax=Candidatus Falkowiibacteriota TaxID=1752728 RepID=A0A1F5TMS3_9BACT|nr:MAG: hypothetical protein A2242_02615 [Candidatus Falkowbacteria bacterium RIFOXYA2_FULL_47_9]OGF39781.1 MAG: hypothetical protein A2477_01250 [Candidatus Falkowbacteria bacterium RIFOXYC2_FULL_47_12]
MKIAVIVSTFPPYHGGMGNSAFEMARLLAAQHDVTVFTMTQDGAGASDNAETNYASLPFKINRLQPSFSFGFKNGGFVPSLYEQLVGFDTLYLCYPFFGGAEIVWLFKLLHPKTKLIINFVMDTPALPPLAKVLSVPSLLIKKSLFKRADKVISASLDYVAHSSVKKYFQKWPDKFVEIPFGVHLDRFHVFPHDILELQALRQRYGIAEKDRVVMFLGALDSAHRFKGVEVLLRAIAGENVKCQISNVKCLVCGDGDLRVKYENLAKELKIEKQVIFAGRVPDEELVLHYNLADIFVLPSTDASEAFGMVLLEAMACGVPVMASDLPGVRSVFENGVQGITVAPGSARHLRVKIEEFLKYPQRRYKMGRAARESVERKYDWRKVGERLEDVITAL